MSNPAYVPHHGETRFASSALISIATSIVVLHGRPSAFQIAAGICIAWACLTVIRDEPIFLSKGRVLRASLKKRRSPRRLLLW
jgi:hypothetical protein